MKRTPRKQLRKLKLATPKLSHRPLGLKHKGQKKYRKKSLRGPVAKAKKVEHFLSRSNRKKEVKFEDAKKEQKDHQKPPKKKRGNFSKMGLMWKRN